MSNSAIVVRSKNASEPASTTPALNTQGAAVSNTTALAGTTTTTAANHATTTTGTKRRKSGQPKSLPPFVKKLWSTVNDKENWEYIHWTADGEAFRVVNREMFEKTVLPKYYKHTNFSSFVRQLNMYGFHKVQDVQHSDEDCWKFESPNFKRGREDLLTSIVRNKNHEDEEEDDMSKILSELQSVKSSLNAVAKDVGEIRKDNQLLWNENMSTQSQYQQHYQTLNKVVRFLSAIYGNQRFQDIASPKAPPQRLLTSGEKVDDESTSYFPPNLVAPNSLEAVNHNNRISDLGTFEEETESSPTNSDKSEENDEQARRILDNTLRANNLQEDVQSSHKALTEIEDFIRQQGVMASGADDGFADQFINLDEYPDMTMPEPTVTTLDPENATKKRRIE